ncbi:MAG TPA: PaaI family thioesterase [Chitinophagaceae bacterium]|nr:PaaI family thioesterase [Chitinophagaceae bacterium]
MDELFNRIEANFKRQGLMKTLNASLDKVQNGLVQISSTFNEGLTQQHNFFHAGVVTSIVDSACGYAALTMVPADKEVLTVEFKVNFLKPAATAKLIAVGKVIQSGKTLTVCEGNVYDEREEKLLAKMTATIMTIGK